MRTLCLLLCLLPACTDDEPSLDCVPLDLSWGDESESNGTRLWSDQLPADQAATWHIETTEDTRCGGDRRVELFDSRRPGPVVTFFIGVDDEGGVHHPRGGAGLTSGFIELRGDFESRFSGRFQAVVDGQTIDGVFADDQVDSQACVANDWLRSLEFVVSEDLINTKGRLVDCDRPTPGEAAACIEAALVAGDGFSAPWQDASGKHAYVGTPWETNRYDFTRESDSSGSYARVSSCGGFARQPDCSSYESCWTCDPGPPSDMCREPS